MGNRPDRGNGPLAGIVLSTKIGIICEGAIDYALLPALLERIARDRAWFTWPLAPDDVAARFPIRKRGHGGVLDTIRRLVDALGTEHFDHACFVILLDRRTEPVQRKVLKLIRGKSRFVLGVAIEEIEAWWLGDRTSTLAWTELVPTGLPGDSPYALPSYRAEKDPHPKRTLSELTKLSNRFDRAYGEGNLDMAIEFAEDYWRRTANLDEIALQCPRGYGQFERRMRDAFRRAKARTGQLP